MLKNSAPAQEIIDFIVGQPLYVTGEMKSDLLRRIERSKSHLIEMGLTVNNINRLRSSHMVDIDELHKLNQIFVDEMKTPKDYIKLFKTYEGETYLLANKNKKIIRETYQQFLDMNPKQFRILHPPELKKKIFRNFKAAS